MRICCNCCWPIWQLGGDPEWEGQDHSKGRPGTVITSTDETKEVDACLECANTREIVERVVAQLDRDL